jgi:hypothetical protein
MLHTLIFISIPSKFQPPCSHYALVQSAKISMLASCIHFNLVIILPPMSSFTSLSYLVNILANQQDMDQLNSIKQCLNILHGYYCACMCRTNIHPIVTTPFAFPHINVPVVGFSNASGLLVTHPSPDLGIHHLQKLIVYIQTLNHSSIIHPCTNCADPAPIPILITGSISGTIPCSSSVMTSRTIFLPLTPPRNAKLQKNLMIE